MCSRERMLAAIDGAQGALIPCAFMMFRALSELCADEYEFADRQIELGLDAWLRLEDLPVRFSSDVTVRESIGPAEKGEPPVLTRAYETPAGVLEASIRRTHDWPYGDKLPLFGDHLVPRTVKALIAEPKDLAPLRHLLAAPADEDIQLFREESAKRSRFAKERGLLLAGGWRGQRRVPGEDKLLVGDNFGTVSVVDTLMWLCGGTAPLLWAYDQPDFLREVISLLEDWNRARLRIHLDAGVDIAFRRAWYEGTDFWSPALYDEFILPSVRRDVELTHQAGARYGYIITTGMIHLADLILEAGVDVIVGIDPGQGKGTTLQEVRDSLGGKVGLWGGVSGPLVVEEGSEEEVRSAVEEAISVLGDTGRFILSPVDNVRADTERSWRNVRVFVETWRSLISSCS